ncbi:hypothetical protein Ocin01_05392 [Orchesella cincta]|uniref:Uncharacterized protein n=1 Tax=Orchesella cincta TaxID=48709 RepID=A0A1D2N7Q2_ORCCI|nr:hypothetical protein Ocin01_05392 [Orchesella cincta]
MDSNYVSSVTNPEKRNQHTYNTQVRIGTTSSRLSNQQDNNGLCWTAFVLVSGDVCQSTTRTCILDIRERSPPTWIQTPEQIRRPEALYT